MAICRVSATKPHLPPFKQASKQAGWYRVLLRVRQPPSDQCHGSVSERRFQMIRGCVTHVAFATRQTASIMPQTHGVNVREGSRG